MIFSDISIIQISQHRTKPSECDFPSMQIHQNSFVSMTKINLIANTKRQNTGLTLQSHYTVIFGKGLPNVHVILYSLFADAALATYFMLFFCSERIQDNVENCKTFFENICVLYFYIIHYFLIFLI